MTITSDLSVYVRRLAENAKKAARVVSTLDSKVKDAALLKMAEYLEGDLEELVVENEKDLVAGQDKGLSAALLDRLQLTPERVSGMALALREVAGLRDPVGEVVAQWKRPAGFEVGQVRIPLGVVGIIFESRPNVTADASGLCFKAGNATLLRGGSEAINSNQAIVTKIRKALEDSGVNPDAVQIVETTDRAAIDSLLKLHELVDLIIPRGGKGLIKRVTEESTIPVIKHYEGICHVYIHREADLKMALEIAVNAKVQRPGTCNAMETLLVDSEVAGIFLPELAKEFSRHQVEIRGCDKTSQLIEVAGVATEEDYRSEYLALTCNVRIVDGIAEAVDHIASFGSRHTDVIVTDSYEVARRFVAAVDSSSVMVNASSRLADGGVYGLGAEIGISTDKLHAYGPMGIKELTTKKFVVWGNGNLRD
jgi:glutamate-5-semialdehyde dehydrogenase